jgi:uncharacterized iron-regulated membrane protein
MGSLFGLPNQILLAAVGTGLVLMIVWGYRMWWQLLALRARTRTPTREKM